MSGATERQHHHLAFSLMQLDSVDDALFVHPLGPSYGPAVAGFCVVEMPVNYAGVNLINL